MNLADIPSAIVTLWQAHPLAQSVGLAASLCYIVATTQRDDNKLFATQLSGAMLFVVHYALLGAWVGAFGYMVGTMRNLTAFLWLKKINNRFLLSAGLFIAYALVAAFTAKNAIDLIPPISGWLTGVAFFHLQGIRMRLLLLCAQSVFVLYAYTVGSIGGLLTAGSEMIFTTITITRLYNLSAPIAQETIS